MPTYYSGKCLFTIHIHDYKHVILQHFQAGLTNPDLESRDCVRLVAAIGCVLSSMPLKDLVGPLESLVSSRVQSLQGLAMEEPTEPNKPLVEKELAILSSLCHHIYPTLMDGEQHPVRTTSERRGIWGNLLYYVP